MTSWARIAVPLASMLLAACAETPRAGFKRDYAAKRFRNPPFDRANIYVYRLTGSWDADLFLDGVRVTTLAKWSFIVMPVRPGIHQLTARYRDQRAGRPKDHADAEMELYTGVGSNYFTMAKKASGIARWSQICRRPCRRKRRRPGSVERVQTGSPSNRGEGLA